jgi:hypothetical protein
MTIVVNVSENVFLSGAVRLTMGASFPPCYIAATLHMQGRDDRFSDTRFHELAEIT